MQITMLSTRYISEDGFSTKPYEKGKTYDVAETAARRAIREGIAVDTELQTPEYLAELVKAV